MMYEMRHFILGCENTLAELVARVICSTGLFFLMQDLMWIIIMTWTENKVFIMDSQCLFLFLFNVNSYCFHISVLL